MPDGTSLKEKSPLRFVVAKYSLPLRDTLILEADEPSGITNLPSTITRLLSAAATTARHRTKSARIATTLIMHSLTLATQPLHTTRPRVWVKREYRRGMNIALLSHVRWR